MAAKKKARKAAARGKAEAPKAKGNLRKLTTLPKSAQDKVNLDDLWVMVPSARARPARARYCGCRNVCIV